MADQRTVWKVEIDQAKFLAGMRQMTAAINNTGTSIHKLNKQTKTLGSRLKSSFVGQVGSVYLLQRAVRAVVGNMVQFEDKMAEIRAITHASEAEFKLLTDTVRGLGATTRFTATEAAEGMSFLARAGLQANETVSALPGTLNLASAGFVSVATAADFTVNVIKQFGIAVAESESIADTFVATANSSNTTVQQLGVTLQYAGSVAGTVGLEFNEVAAAAGLLANAGIKGSRAGTQLRGIIATLLDPTRKARDVIEGLGLKVEDLRPGVNATTGEVVTLNDVFLRLREAGFGAEEAIKIFRKRQIAGALVLAEYASATDDSTKSLKGFTKALDGNVGASKKAAGIVEDTLGGAFRRLKSAIQEINLTLADEGGFSGGLRGVVDTFTHLARSLGGVENAAAGLGATAVFVSETLKALLLILVLQKGFGLIGALRAAAIAAGSFSAAIATIASRNTVLVAGLAVAIGAYNAFTRAVFKNIDAHARYKEVARPEKLKEQVAKLGQDFEDPVKRGEELFATLNRLESEFIKLEGSSKRAMAEWDRIPWFLRGFPRLSSYMHDVTGLGVKMPRPEQLKEKFGADRKALVQDLREAYKGVAEQLRQVEGIDPFVTHLMSLNPLLAKTDELRNNLLFVAELLHGFTGPGFEAALPSYTDISVPWSRESVEAALDAYQEIQDEITVLEAQVRGANEAEIALLEIKLQTKGKLNDEEEELLQKAIATRAELEGQLDLREKAAEAAKAAREEAEALETALKNAHKDQARDLQRAQMEQQGVKEEYLQAFDVIVGTGNEWGKVRKVVKDVIAGTIKLRLNIEKAAADKALVATFEQQTTQLEQQNELQRLRASGTEEEIANQILLIDLARSKLEIEALTTDQVKSRLEAIKHQLRLDAARKDKSAAEQEKRIESAWEARLSIQREMNLLEQEAAGATAAELEAQRMVWELKDQGVEADKEDLAILLQKAENLREMVDLARTMEETLAGAFTDLFSSLVTGTESLGEALKNFLTSLTKQITELLLQLALSKIFSGLFSPFSLATPGGAAPTGGGGLAPGGIPIPYTNAKGNIFSGGIRPWASGGVVQSPAYFASGGRMNVMGEAGPEAVLPLGRDAQGRLGVRGGGGTTIVVNVSTPDADSFIKSKRQVATATNRALRYGMQGQVRGI